MKIVNEKEVYVMECPNANAILVLGILSLLLCWNYEFLGFILAILVLVISSKSRRLFKSNSKQYGYSSYKLVVVGRICAIIALVISIFALLFTVLILFGIVGGIGLFRLKDMFI